MIDQQVRQLYPYVFKVVSQVYAWAKEVQQIPENALNLYLSIHVDGGNAYLLEHRPPLIDQKAFTL